MTLILDQGPNSFSARLKRREQQASSAADFPSQTLQETFSGSSTRIQGQWQAILKNPDVASRWTDLLHLGVRLKQDQQNELAARLLGIVAASAPDAVQRQQAQGELGAIVGNGPGGMRFEFLTSRFSQEVIEPKLILPMMAGSLVGRLAGTTVSARLAGLNPSILTRGLAARGAAGLTSYVAEVPVFAGAQWALSGGKEDFGSILKRSAVTLAFLKGASGLSGEAIRGIHGVSALGPTRLQSYLSLSQAVLPQSAMFMGLLGAHQAEKALGLRPHVAGEHLYLDTLASMFSLSVGSHLGGRALGPNFARLQNEMAARTEAFFRSGNELNSQRWNIPQLAPQLAVASGSSARLPRLLSKLPQHWMASEMNGPEKGSGPDSSGKGSSLVPASRKSGEMVPLKSRLAAPLLVKDAMQVGLSTLFSIDTLQQNLRPMIIWSGLSVGAAYLISPPVGMAVFVLSAMGLIGSHVWGHVRYFLDSGEAGRTQNRVQLSINQAASKNKQLSTEMNPEFVEHVNAVVETNQAAAPVSLARELKDKSAEVVRESLDKYYGPNLAAKLSIIVRAKLKQGAKLLVDALELKGLSPEAITWLLQGLAQLGDAATLKTWAEGKGRVKNSSTRLQAAKALLEMGEASVALTQLEAIADSPPIRGKDAFQKDLELALASAKHQAGQSLDKSRFHLLNYWRLAGGVDYPSLKVLRAMEDRELFEMIFDQKGRTEQMEAKEKLKREDYSLYRELFPDPDAQPSEAPAPEIHPVDRLRQRFPDIHKTLYRHEIPILRNEAFSELAKYIWNPELHPDPRATAEIIHLLKGFLAEWSVIGEALNPLIGKLVEKGKALDIGEAMLARSLLDPKFEGTKNQHKLSQFVDKVEHSPEALLELGWAFQQVGAKTAAKEIAEKLLLYGPLSIEADRLLEAIGSTSINSYRTSYR